MMKTSKILLLLVFLSLSTYGISETIYLDYSKSCMDRFEYHLSGNFSDESHVAYHIKINDHEKVILYTDIESKTPRIEKPARSKSCSQLRSRLSQGFVKEINSGETNVYVIRKDPSEGFFVISVVSAYFISNSPNKLSVTSKTGIYEYDYNKDYNENHNLSTIRNGVTYNYKGTLSYKKPRKFLFSQKTNKNGKNYQEFEYVDGLGYVSQKIGYNEKNADKYKLELRKINGKPLKQVLAALQKGNNGGLVSGLGKGSTNGNSIVDIENGNSKPTMPFNNSNNTTNQPTSNSDCRIWKNQDDGFYYEWNTGKRADGRCAGNSYRNGVMLGKFSPSNTNVATTTGPTKPTSTSKPVVTPDPIPVKTTKPSKSFCNETSTYSNHIVQPNETLYGISKLHGLTVPQLRSMNGLTKSNTIYPCMKLKIRDTETFAAREVVDEEPFVYDKDGFHVVQPNETIYQLANNYGFTVNRFRTMNDLNKTDRIVIGQVLKTTDCNCPAPDKKNIPVSAEFSNTDYVPASYSTDDLKEKGGIPTEYAAVQKRSVHIVKENETVFGIAKAYNISVARLRSINNLEKNEIIIPYQRLYIN